MPDSSHHKLRLLRRAGRDLTHEIKNQLGVAMGSVDLVRDEVEGDLARKDLDRAIRALSELDLLVTEVQSALRREDLKLDQPDLAGVLRETIRQFSSLPGNQDRVVRVRLPEGPVKVRYPEDVLREVLGRLLSGGREGPLDLLLQEALSEPDPELVQGEYCVLLSRGGRDRMASEGWSFEAERFRIRSLGGDLRSVSEGLLLFFPLAQATRDEE